MLYKKIFISAVSLVIVFVFSACITFAQEVETYEVDNMEFTVGKHKPKERINPKKKKQQIVAQTIIVGEDEQLPGLLDENLEKDFLENENKIEKEENIEIEKPKVEKEEVVQEKKEISMGILTEGVWKIIKDVVFSASVVFENVVSYLDRVTFMDRVTFADKDMAGKAVIKKGSREVKIVYEKQFITKPIVTATAKDTTYNFAIQDETENGFTLVIDEVIEEDLVFSWIAIKIADFTTFESEKNEEKSEEKKDADKKEYSKKEVKNDSKKDEEKNIQVEQDDVEKSEEKEEKNTKNADDTEKGVVDNEKTDKLEKDDNLMEEQNNEDVEDIDEIKSEKIQSEEISEDGEK